MSLLPLFNPPTLFIEIGQNSLKAMRGNDGLELPVERQDNGLLTRSCKDKLVESLRGFARPPALPPRPKVFCAIGARGVSLRRFKLPAAGGEELRRLLLLQIESEFPLPPEELAWGCHPVEETTSLSNDTPASREWVVAAVKKETVGDYASMLGECGLDPVFTLGALARRGLCLQPPVAYAILDIAAHGSELIAFERGAPVSMRVLPWGEEDILRAIQKKLGVGRDEAQQLRIRTRQDPADANAAVVQAAMDTEWERLTQMLTGAGFGKKLFLAGADAQALAPRLSQKIGEGVTCEPLGPVSGNGQSAAILGLRHFCEQNGGAPPLVFEAKAPKAKDTAARSASWTWAVLAVVLAFGSYCLRYAEPVLFQTRLANKIAETKAKRDKLPNIDRELNFLQYLKTNQPPYLEAVAMLAKAAPSGMRLESLAMNRRGDLSYRGYVRDMQQALDFRAKLVDSGFFTNVVLEEQSPTPDRQKMNLRIVAQWKPVAAREVLVKELALPENNKTNAPGKEVKPGGFPDGGNPANMAMPSGFMMPPGGEMPPGMSGPPMNMGMPPGMSMPPPMEGGPPPSMIPPPGADRPSAAPSRRPARGIPSGDNPAVIERKD